jgi:hypothetical protein
MVVFIIQMPSWLSVRLLYIVLDAGSCGGRILADISLGSVAIAVGSF